MEQARIDAIERYIAGEEAAGREWSGRAVYRAVGGSHDNVQRYLKAREATQPRRNGRGSPPPVDTAAVVAAMPAQVPTSLQEDLDAALQAEQAAEARLAHLEAKAATDMLSEDEEVESIRLERRVRNLAAVITRLETELAQAKETMDIDGFVAQWAPLADAKRHLYEDFRAKAVELWQALLAILQQHEEQIILIQTLPIGIQRYMLDTFLPDAATCRARLAGNMINPQGWTSVLCSPGPPHVALAETLMQNDPGTQLLPPRLLHNALEQRRGVVIERSA